MESCNGNFNTNLHITRKTADIHDLQSSVRRIPNLSSILSRMNPHLIILLSLAAVISAANEPIAIIRQEQDSSPDGSYFVRWESANGITFEEQGVQKNSGQKDKEAEEVRGSASWTAPDGQKINLGWLADENGAIFQGAHLPTPPPAPEIPPAIQRALEWIAAHPYQEERNKV